MNVVQEADKIYEHARLKMRNEFEWEFLHRGARNTRHPDDDASQPLYSRDSIHAVRKDLREYFGTRNVGSFSQQTVSDQETKLVISLINFRLSHLETRINLVAKAEAEYQQKVHAQMYGSIRGWLNAVAMLSIEGRDKPSRELDAFVSDFLDGRAELLINAYTYNSNVCDFIKDTRGSQIETLAPYILVRALDQEYQAWQDDKTPDKGVFSAQTFVNFLAEYAVKAQDDLAASADFYPEFWADFLRCIDPPRKMDEGKFGPLEWFRAYGLLPLIEQASKNGKNICAGLLKIMDGPKLVAESFDLSQAVAKIMHDVSLIESIGGGSASDILRAINLVERFSETKVGLEKVFPDPDIIRSDGNQPRIPLRAQRERIAEKERSSDTPGVHLMKLRFGNEIFFDVVKPLLSSVTNFPPSVVPLVASLYEPLSHGFDPSLHAEFVGALTSSLRESIVHAPQPHRR